MRKENPAILDGLFKMLLPEHPQIVMYQRSCTRQTLLVVANFGDTSMELEQPEQLKEHGWKRIMTNYPEKSAALESGTLQPWQAEIYERIC
jgi:oligo-1,6-glucosidase